MYKTSYLCTPVSVLLYEDDYDAKTVKPGAKLSYGSWEYKSYMVPGYMHKSHDYLNIYLVDPMQEIDWINVTA